jgi:hypothetical protein
MNSFRYNQDINGNAELFNHLACVCLLFFCLAVVGPSATSNWFGAALAAPILSGQNQPGELPATAEQQLEEKSDFNKQLLLFSSVAVYLVSPCLSAGFTCLLFFCGFIRLFNLWLLPACPRPPPRSLFSSLN